VKRLPYLGPRYDAGRQVTEMARLIGDAGGTSATIAREVLDAFETTGVFADGPNAGHTWFTVLDRHASDLDDVSRQFAEARSLRAELDVDHLPETAKYYVERFDRLIDRFPLETVIEHDVAALRAALTPVDDEPVRYMVLFQNPAELRLGGGFQGTVAVVTLERGQIADIDFSPSSPLSHAYNENRSEIVPLPYPIEQTFPQYGFQIQDATWWADFTRGGADFMMMYEETGWPPIRGVVALQPSVIADLVEIFGPFDVSVEESIRHITAENVYQEIELQQRRTYAREEDAIHHKELVEIIGEELIHGMREADQSDLLTAARSMKVAADRRDIQVYSSDPDVLEALDRHRWSGKVMPDPETPTLAIAFANVAINKASLRMQPEFILTLGEPRGGIRPAHLRIIIEHTGDPDDAPMFHGFQRWWTEVYLPDGATAIAHEPEDEADPGAPNGGSYLIDIFPLQTREIALDLALPDFDQVLIRRQPGVTTAHVVVVDETCGREHTAWLDRDIELDLRELCDE
jgi:hypothetical protein